MPGTAWGRFSGGEEKGKRWVGWDQICGLTGWVGVVRCKSEAIIIEVGWDTVEDER